MSLFPGALIRRQRMRQNWSQEGLCSGICAVSYLSKIEQGKVQAGEDILLPLLERLGIRYETDPDFLARAGALIDRLYEDVYDGLSLLDSAPVEGRLAELKEERERLLASPYMLDVLLLEGLLLWRTPDAALGEFVPCMTGRQYELHLLLSLLGGNDRAGEELLRLNPCGFFTCQVGVRRYWEGRNMESAELLGRAYLLAAQEGRAHLMLIAKVYLGNCCCDTGWLELMEEHYRAARKLGQALGDQGALLSDIDYNEATSYLEWGMAEKGLAMLEGLERDDALYFHKLAIALEKAGRREEALEAVARGRAAPCCSSAAPLMEDMLGLVEYRLLHPGYLRDGIYAPMAADLFARIRREQTMGSARFHLPYMLEVLEAERRYRDAYRLLAEFSEQGRKIGL